MKYIWISLVLDYYLLLKIFSLIGLCISTLIIIPFNVVEGNGFELLNLQPYSGENLWQVFFYVIFDFMKLLKNNN